jgi:hypothetical protein
MNTGDLKIGKAVRWDTNTNKIYFDIERSSVRGRLVLRKNADGKIDMYVVQSEVPATVTINR